MATAAAAAREFATGPQVLPAAQALLGRFPLPVLCEAFGSAQPEDPGGGGAVCRKQIGMTAREQVGLRSPLLLLMSLLLFGH